MIKKPFFDRSKSNVISKKTNMNACRSVNTKANNKEKHTSLYWFVSILRLHSILDNPLSFH